MVTRVTVDRFQEGVVTADRTPGTVSAKAKLIADARILAAIEREVDLARRRRDASILTLVREGVPYREIGTLAGISNVAVTHIVKRAKKFGAEMIAAGIRDFPNDCLGMRP